MERAPRPKLFGPGAPRSAWGKVSVHGRSLRWWLDRAPRPTRSPPLAELSSLQALGVPASEQTPVYLRPLLPLNCRFRTPWPDLKASFLIFLPGSGLRRARAQSYALPGFQGPSLKLGCRLVRLEAREVPRCPDSSPDANSAAPAQPPPCLVTFLSSCRSGEGLWLTRSSLRTQPEARMLIPSGALQVRGVRHCRSNSAPREP